MLQNKTGKVTQKDILGAIYIRYKYLYHTDTHVCKDKNSILKFYSKYAHFWAFQWSGCKCTKTTEESKAVHSN